jgi:hypothetical protein
MTLAGRARCFGTRPYAEISNLWIKPTSARQQMSSGCNEHGWPLRSAAVVRATKRRKLRLRRADSFWSPPDYQQSMLRNELLVHYKDQMLTQRYFIQSPTHNMESEIDKQLRVKQARKLKNESDVLLYISRQAVMERGGSWGLTQTIYNHQSAKESSTDGLKYRWRMLDNSAVNKAIKRGKWIRKKEVIEALLRQMMSEVR